MVTISKWLGTNVFNSDFLEAWDDERSKLLFVKAYKKWWKESPERRQFQATIWIVNILSALATSVMQFLGHKNLKLDDDNSVGAILNPFKEDSKPERQERKLTKAEIKELTEKKDAEVFAAFFGGKRAEA